ncbi:MAG TPA: hypothetical protein VLF14_02965 [Candidatus Binatia bacterium]|nr:hypothetical protein [Candidatus Binatia bacterium]
MPRKKRGRRRVAPGALMIVRRARAAAKSALDSLRSEIRLTTAKLAKLVSEERIFKSELFGAAPARQPRPGRPRKAGRGGKPARVRPRRRGTPQAEKYFRKLGKAFTLEDVRKLAGRRAGISIAQWSRAKRIRKVGDGYQKVA